MAKNQKHYTLEFKQQIVALYNAGQHKRLPKTCLIFGGDLRKIKAIGGRSLQTRTDQRKRFVLS